jgi:transcriptional regulator with XRE-family HTH domain
VADSIGREVLLARTNLGLSVRAAARRSGVAPETQVRVERGDPGVSVSTACRVAAAVGLKVWAKAFPTTVPSLRDTGQLRIADILRQSAHPSLRAAVELALGNGRSCDVVLFGATEIVHIEIERVIADFQAQYRAAAAKRDELAASHSRPVRLVLVVEDTTRNRRMLGEHRMLVRSVLPAGSRAVFAAVRGGRPLGRDGLLWIRPRSHRPGRPGGASGSDRDRLIDHLRPAPAAASQSVDSVDHSLARAARVGAAHGTR